VILSEIVRFGRTKLRKVRNAADAMKLLQHPTTAERSKADVAITPPYA
jgi:predicted phage tail protein